MKRIVKLAIVRIAIVAIAGISLAVEGSAWICPLCTASKYVTVTATPDHYAGTITVDFSYYEGWKDDISGVDVWYWQDGSSTKTHAYSTDKDSWTHSSPTVDVTYKYEAALNDVDWTDMPRSATPASTTLRAVPSVTSASYDESSNTISFTTNVALNSVDHSNVCMMSVDKSNIYHARCGTSATQSGDYRNITIDGEISGGTSIVTQYLLVKDGALESKHNIKNSGDQEIYHGVRITPMSVSSVSFDESTNTITMTTSMPVKSLKQNNICIVVVDTNDNYHWRCGVSNTLLGYNTNIVVDGEISSGLELTSRYFHIQADSVQSIEGVYNSAAQEIYHGVRLD